MKKASRFAAATAFVAVAALALAGCSSSGESNADPTPNEVTIFGGYGEAQAASFQAELDEWSKTSGIKVTFTPLAAYDKDIKVKIEAGEAPDIGMWPQPGGLKDTAATGALVALEDLPGFDIAAPKATLVPGWDTLAQVDGKTYGLPVSANVKTLVFYNPAEFAKNGYAVPTTDAELTALAEKIKADGKGYPWCFGIESGQATGWPVTDWMEQYVLDYNGSADYASWVAGTIPFTDAKIKKAADKVSSMLLADGMVNGGGAQAVSTNFGDTAALFETGGKAKGQCFMLRQGSFITDFFPDKIKAELAAKDYTNANVFALPAPADGQAGVIGGGDLAAAFNTNEDTAKVMQFITSDKVGTLMASKSSFVSPHKTFDNALYPDEMTKTFGSTMANAAVFGFDGSDQMPGEVNSEFWAAGTEWVGGKISWDEAAARIAAKYPTS